MIRRRILLVALAAIPGYFTLGCTTPEMACGLRANYATETPPWTQGTVTVRWEYNAELPPSVSGQAECFGTEQRFCILRMRGPAASYRDVCGMAKQEHELMHAMGAQHERDR